MFYFPLNIPPTGTDRISINTRKTRSLLSINIQTLNWLNINISFLQDVQEGLHGGPARPARGRRKLPQGEPPVINLAAPRHTWNDSLASMGLCSLLRRMLTAGALMCLLWTQPALIAHSKLSSTNWLPDTGSTVASRSLSMIFEDRQTSRQIDRYWFTSPSCVNS